ncbi:MAG: GYF domain-containing protein [Planctomycetia bacterium]
MSGWYYRLLGEEFGPVSQQTLQELMRDGTIAQTDQVRASESTEWVEAATIFAEAQDADDVLNDLSQLSFEFEESGPGKSNRGKHSGTPQPVTAEADEVEEESGSPTQYFCQFLGQTIGPLALETLIRMAELGRLRETDLVRQEDEFLWQAASEYHELSAAFLLRAAEPQPAQASGVPGSETVKKTASTESSKTAAGKVPASRPASDTVSPAAPAEVVSVRNSGKGSGATEVSRSEKGKNKGKGKGKQNVPDLAEDVFQEVFAERENEKKVSSEPRSVRSALQERAENSSGGLNPEPPIKDMSQPAIASPLVSSTGAFGTAATASVAAKRPPLSPLRSPAAKSSSGRRWNFDFDFEFGTPMKVLAGMLFFAALWFGYGPVMRYLSTNEGHYIGRAEEAIKTLEGINAVSDQEKYKKFVDTMSREMGAYLAIMKEAGATGTSSVTCVGAMNRLVEYSKLDPSNVALRNKLLKEAQQLISKWKGE